jgi:hypothetical protein
MSAVFLSDNSASNIIKLLIILFQQRCQMSAVFLSDNSASNIIKLLIFLFQQRCQTFGRNRDLGPHHRVGSDDDPASRGHAADQDDADHLSLFCGETFQLMFLQMANNINHDPIKQLPLYLKWKSLFTDLCLC